jgi:hypothetical protein
LESAQPPIRYILGARMRRQKEVSEQVLRRRGAWQTIHEERTRSKDPAPLKVREVTVSGRRYIVCLNEEERRKDERDRAAIVEHLRRQLKEGDKSLVGNKGYRRFLKLEGAGHFAVDEERVESEARFDGVWVLRTNTDYEMEIVALAYKRLWMVEAIIRTAKTILETRPIHHRSDAAIRGHVFWSSGCGNAMRRGNGRRSCGGWTTFRKWKPCFRAVGSCSEANWWAMRPRRSARREWRFPRRSERRNRGEPRRRKCVGTATFLTRNSLITNASSFESVQDGPNARGIGRSSRTPTLQNPPRIG